LPTPDVLREMRDGHIRVAIFQGTNPMVMEPQPASFEAALEKVGYLVVVDPYLSETAQEADLVLPAATYLERTEPEWYKVDYDLTCVKLRQKAVTVGEAKSDPQILIDLGRKLGFTDVFPTDDITWYIDELLKGTGITYQRLVDHPEGIQAAPVDYRKYEKTGFDVPGGKANIRSVILEEHGFDPFPLWEEPAESPRNAPELAKEYPFVLFSGRAGPMYVHSQGRTIPWLREIRPEPMVMIHPDKAAELGIQHGDWTVVESPRGSIRIKADVTLAIGPNCLYVPGGWAEANYNELGIEDVIDPISSQSNYMMCAGRIRKE